MKAYYDARAPEYDEWYEGRGRFEELDRPAWEDEIRELELAVASLPPARTLDVACGTGFLTRHLRGEIVGLDQSERMLAIARERVPHGTFVRADATDLPFEDGAFERLFTGHFYGHLEDAERQAVLAEARRVARDLVVADEGEHRAVVVGVGMHVEQLGVRRERGCEGVDRVAVAPLGEVRHRFEGQLHHGVL